ncbi:type II CRISPR RNA-guided endonuclease Cas9 [Elizabethkingia sp. JS20170427COW]|uniref:type II CRISPR RNA-guided endonuclease Cas9 n=1 Tax=Elizabethkingia sp. JS20170427COW TaxID=2583851 RepID=UPI00111034C9|nr:type II CRISPR RNA-guided endonuclease Cas9 [Elizabethkingia sp. JS20170427COW]QCX52427.1 type II CRISPR RNA-guided endonuclease Cas9 [Elizabethkingia sp. JS20170427COW]
MAKKILGLDLGTNSIGWALVNLEEQKILGMGSRIIPMDAGDMGKFAEGGSISQTAKRTGYRGVRRLRERHLLRRERLHRVLHILKFLPTHFDAQIDFEKRFGKIKPGIEPKIAFSKDGFLFKDSFNKMLEDFKTRQPDFLKGKNGEDVLVPYDWTIYYLRKKALTQKIEKEELAWIILNFNQKRGYYQLRGESEDEDKKEIKEFCKLLKVVAIEKGDVDKKNNKKSWYKLIFDNGWEYSATFSTEPNWINSEREFLITEEYDENNNIKIVKDKRSDKTGKEKRRITPLPSFDEINLMSKKDQDKIYKKIKARTEFTIRNSNTTVGTYIYDHLLLNPKQKIKGKLVRTIERKFYKEELKQILIKQKDFHPELQDENLLMDCIRELYKNNKQHQQQLSSKDFVHLFLEDIIFYQRPLRSQKSLISNCSLESRTYTDKEGKEHLQPLKVVSKSNPYFQEFRLLQWLQNLAFYKKEDDTNVTSELLPSSRDWEELLDFLNQRKEVDQKQILDFLLKKKLDVKKLPKGETEKYRWNYVEDKTYPCNETRYLIQSKLDKVQEVLSGFLTFEKEMELWHIIYSVNDKIEYEKALRKFAAKNNLDEASFVDSFKKFPPFKSDYGSFSEKALKKLLPLMRFGSSWSWDSISKESQARIEKIITGEVDDKIADKIRDLALKHQLVNEQDFQGLPLWLAQYIVYGRHSEATISGKWNSPTELEAFLKNFKQHSLRNPIVEQVITETLRVVKDIWSYYGSGAKDYFSEIHIELGRDMKNTAEERKRLTNQVTENENTNLRIKALLAEMALDGNVENVRPYSPSQQEILKIYEEGALNSDIEIDEAILKISKTPQPSSSDLKRYKLWLEQKYRSPYTGQIIPLNKLFTSSYEVEHIIPQSRYFDDSFSNKVICEAEVNKLKDKQIGLEFIKNHHGEKVTIGNKTVQILEVSAYEDFVKKNYAKNRSKRNKLLLEDIPEKMIERQMNDTRYISKYISNLLSNIVRDERPGANDDGFNSKNLIPGNGKITTRLKQDWGLEAVWNELILPRFERMNTLTKTNDFTKWNEKYQKFLPTVPLELSKGFSKKRIDHRHHAMDALVIACASRDHINLLNNESALPKKNRSKEEQKKFRIDLQKKLRNQESYLDKDGVKRTSFTEFYKPWENFTVDAKNALENIVVSFKQNTRVINKATNYYEKYVEKNGEMIKTKVPQEGINWAIRKPLHKETVSGKIHLDYVKVAKGKILTATRKSLDTTFNEKTILSITDTGIQKILLNYLKAKGSPELAFSPEGIEELNENIKSYNDGKYHQPIFKVRIFEQGSKFPLGETGNKQAKFVEAAKGTNLFFAVYADENGKRSFDTIPLNIVIERQKQGLSSVPEINEKGDRLLFHLSPNDLVYIPTDDRFDNLNSNNIYKMVSCTGSECHFIPFRIASLIKNYDAKTKVGEFGSLNKQELSESLLNPVRVKEKCIKLKVDRLGNISNA